MINIIKVKKSAYVSQRHAQEYTRKKLKRKPVASMPTFMHVLTTVIATQEKNS